MEPWTKGRKRKAISSTKLFFFDVGVAKALLGIKSYSERDTNAGWQFEQFIAEDLFASRDYRAHDLSLNFWRSTDKHEVDFILDDSIAIEVKHTSLVNERDLKGLHALRDEGKFKRKIVVSRHANQRKINDIEIMPYRYFLQALWNNDIVP